MAENKDKKVLNVPALRFPEFGGEWEKCKLGDITINFNLRNKDRINYPMYSVTNNRGFVPQSEQFEDREMIGEDIKAYKIIHKNDFAYNPARINVGSIAKFNEDNPCMISSLYVCFKACDKVDADWLMQLLKTSKMNFYYNINGEGGVRIYLFYPNFARISTFLPVIAEQKKIAKFLSLLDERIVTQNKIIEKLETLIKGIVDFIFTANKFPKVPFKEIYTRAGEGGTPATSIPEYYDNGTIPFIKIDDLQNKYIESNKDYITELGLQKSSAWIVPSNSIIYSNGATIGAISINLFPVCTKQGILGVVPKAYMNVEFLYYFMTSTVFTKAVERIVTEGTMRTAYLKDINHIPCPIPCSAQQNEIAKLLSTLSAKLENETTFQRKLQKQKEFLLSQMFI